MIMAAFRFSQPKTQLKPKYEIGTYTLKHSSLKGMASVGGLESSLPEASSRSALMSETCSE